MTGINYKDYLTTDKPLKSLTKGVKNTSGRNSFGRITSRWRGAGNKRNYRQIDFKFNKLDIPAKIVSIEYDPYRTAFISLVTYADGEKRYILSYKGAKVDDKFIVSEKAENKIGNRMMLKNIPVGTIIYNVELKKNSGAKLARSAGSYVELIAIDKGEAHLKMPSTEIRKVPDDSFATIGQASNDEHQLINIGKAGRSRKMGRRPKTRASVMNPVDHPYGGGEGKAGIGRRKLVTKWGKPSGKGQKTRNPNKYSNSLIVKRRKVGKRK